MASEIEVTPITKIEGNTLIESSYSMASKAEEFKSSECDVLLNKIFVTKNENDALESMRKLVHFANEAQPQIVAHHPRLQVTELLLEHQSCRINFLMFI